MTNFSSFYIYSSFKKSMFRSHSTYSIFFPDGLAFTNYDYTLYFKIMLYYILTVYILIFSVFKLKEYL